jgi:hypothetical protein
MSVLAFGLLSEGEKNYVQKLAIRNYYISCYTCEFDLIAPG